MSYYLSLLRQVLFIPTPPITENNLPDQTGRVHIVTGGYAGCGKELSKILYQHNSTVYVAGRSPEKAQKAIEEIKKAHPSSDGRVEFLKVDLADLSSIKPAVEEFMKKEQRLDVLTNNAGVMLPPAGSKDAQGYELQMGTNCLGTFLLTKLLTPLLQKTTGASKPGSVRVTWAASLATNNAPQNGVAWDPSTGQAQNHAGQWLNYGQSKAGNALLAKAYSDRHSKDGIVSNAWNPGNLQTELARHTPAWQRALLPILTYPPINGAYTELFAGWAEEPAKPEHKGAYIGPWGRFVMLRPDIDNSPDTDKFWDWCDKETKTYQ